MSGRSILGYSSRQTSYRDLPIGDGGTTPGTLWSASYTAERLAEASVGLTINDVATPTPGTIWSAGFTREQLAASAAGLSVRGSVVAATTLELTGTYTSGPLGQILDDEFQLFPAIDGVTVTVGQRVLVKDQPEARANGIYILAVNSGRWRLDRASDMDGSPSAEVQAGVYTFVQGGALYARTGWAVQGTGQLLATDPVLVNNAPIVWAQFSRNVAAGDGLTLSGGTFAVASNVMRTTGATMSGMLAMGANPITTASTVDGVDIAARDAILTSTTATANAALPRAGGALTGPVTTSSTITSTGAFSCGSATGFGFAKVWERLGGVNTSGLAPPVLGTGSTAVEPTTTTFQLTQLYAINGCQTYYIDVEVTMTLTGETFIKFSSPAVIGGHAENADALRWTSSVGGGTGSIQVNAATNECWLLRDGDVTLKSGESHRWRGTFTLVPSAYA